MKKEKVIQTLIDDYSKQAKLSKRERTIFKHGLLTGIEIGPMEEPEMDLEKALSDLDKDIKEFVTTEEFERESETYGHYWAIAKHAFLLGLEAQKGK